MVTRTTTQLLALLTDPSNHDLWRSFDDRYRPVILSFARSRGLSDDDAAEVAQLTLSQFAADYRDGRYQRDRGRLSSWLIGIARNRINDCGRDRLKRRLDRGESVLIDLPVAATDADVWESARRKSLFARALEVLRTDSRLDPRTIRAFELTGIHNTPPEAAASECGMTVAEVYVAKNRAIRKLREIVSQLTLEFDEP